MEPSNFFTSREAADKLKVRTARVCKLIADGVLKTKSAFGVRLITRSSLEKWHKKAKQAGGRPRKSIPALGVKNTWIIPARIPIKVLRGRITLYKMNPCEQLSPRRKRLKGDESHEQNTQVFRD